MSAARLAGIKLKIPTRIERGPTDILKALAATVKYVPSEPDYGLQEDPFLLPTRPNDRKIYLLSRLSGIKAAKFFLNKNPELFFRNDAEPKIDAFVGKEEFDPSMEFTEADIDWCIDHDDAVNGAVAYKAMIERNVPIKNETLLKFFELMCHTNQDNPKQEIDRERARLVNYGDSDLVNMTWRNDGIAQKLFEEIKDTLDPPRVYSAMIAGLSKFNEHVAARQIFYNFRHKYPKQSLYIEAYDGLIRSVTRLNSSSETIKNALDEIITHMQDGLVKPNLNILNSILFVYRVSQVDVFYKDAYQIVNDMISLNIDPSLNTISSIILIMVKDRSTRTNTDSISSILDYVRNNDNILEIRDDRDVDFLSRMMALFSTRLHNANLAKNLHKIYQKRPHLFQSNSQKRRYFDNYFRLIITTESLENIYKFYLAHTSYDFEPSRDSYDALAEALEMYQAPKEIIDKIAGDIIRFKMAGKLNNDAIYRGNQKYVDAVQELFDKGG